MREMVVTTGVPEKTSNDTKIALMDFKAKIIVSKTRPISVKIPMISEYNVEILSTVNFKFQLPDTKSRGLGSYF